MQDRQGGNEPSSAHRLRLYFRRNSAVSARALVNLRELCAAADPSSVEIEVVDVSREPRRVVLDDLLITPALDRLAPAPMVETSEQPSARRWA